MTTWHNPTSFLNHRFTMHLCHRAAVWIRERVGVGRCACCVGVLPECTIFYSAVDKKVDVCVRPTSGVHFSQYWLFSVSKKMFLTLAPCTAAHHTALLYTERAHLNLLQVIHWLFRNTSYNPTLNTQTMTLTSSNLHSFHHIRYLQTHWEKAEPNSSVN